MKHLKKIALKKDLFAEAESLAITDNAKLQDLVIPENCFAKVQYLSLQGKSYYHNQSHSIDLPELTNLDIDAGVMESGGFCVMRSTSSLVIQNNV